MRVIIIEDELPAYEKLESLVKANLQDAELLGWARSVKEARKLLSDNKTIDLIFSDIELLDGNSLELFEETKIDCPIIFTTAFDQYLFQAFQTNGIAYLLKPYEEAAFQEALSKYKTLFSSGRSSTIDPLVISEIRNIIEGERKSYKRRFTVKKKTGIKILNVEDIVSFEANGDFSIAYDASNNKHIINSVSYTHLTLPTILLV